MLLTLAAGASASTIAPLPTPTQSGSCAAGGLFGSVAPDGNALVGIQYVDPETGNFCILNPGGLVPSDELIVTLYTPNQLQGNSVKIGVQEFTWGSERLAYPGPNNTTTYRTVGAPTNVVESDANVSAVAGEVQRFGLDVPPVFTTPANAENLTISILGLQLAYRIATPLTAAQVPVTEGGLIAWLAAMSPAAVVVFVGGFVPGEWVVRRLRHVSTGMYAGLLALFVSVAIGVGVASDFTSFLYWLGGVGISGLALLLLLPLFLWGIALWVTIRGKRLLARFVRGPIAKVSKWGEPIVGLLPLRVYGGGDTGHPEEVIEGPGIGGLGAAWHRFLGLRIFWKPTGLTPRPKLIRYEFQGGKVPFEGEYAAWPKAGSTDKLDIHVDPPEVIWFPWRKSVKERFGEARRPEEPNGQAAVVPTAPGAAPAAGLTPPPSGHDDHWAHRGFFLGLRHGEAKAWVLGSPDHVGPEAYIRGLAPAAAFGKESQRRGTIIVLQNETMDAKAEERAFQLDSIRTRMEGFPGSPEALEGARMLTVRHVDALFDEEAFQRRLTAEGARRVDYRPPGASRYEHTESVVAREAKEPRPPELRK